MVWKLDCVLSISTSFIILNKYRCCSSSGGSGGSSSGGGGGGSSSSVRISSICNSGCNSDCNSLIDYRYFLPEECWPQIFFIYLSVKFASCFTSNDARFPSGPQGEGGGAGGVVFISHQDIEARLGILSTTLFIRAYVPVLYFLFALSLLFSCLLLPLAVFPCARYPVSDTHLVHGSRICGLQG